MIAAGLCDRCRHRRDVTSDRGSRFVLCLRAREDPSFPRYPRLPVLACRGFEPELPGAGSPEDRPRQERVSDGPGREDR